MNKDKRWTKEEVDKLSKSVVSLFNTRLNILSKKEEIKAKIKPCVEVYY